ncbi:MAG: DUF1292 domain-containing protein, partial [Nitrosomonas sp.]|nr:DUF1292 domain-containing protein [Nitrosomonas sp.]
MNKTFMLLVSFFLITAPVSAMKIEADPRTIISFMDSSLPPELDILRVTADVSEDNHLIFQVQTKGERISGKNDDYLLLNILHEKTYALIIPLNKETKESIQVYEGELRPEKQLSSIAFKKSEINNEHAGFSVRRIHRGVEFTIPLDWINFAADFGFDAYTVQASTKEDALHINAVYDQARRGRTQEKRLSAITLLNNICSP